MDKLAISVIRYVNILTVRIFKKNENNQTSLVAQYYVYSAV